MDPLWLLVGVVIAVFVYGIVDLRLLSKHLAERKWR